MVVSSAKLQTSAAWMKNIKSFIKILNKISQKNREISILQFQIIFPLLINLWIFSRIPLSYLQIPLILTLEVSTMQSFLVLMLFLGYSINNPKTAWDGTRRTRRTRRWRYKRVWFLKQLLALTLLRFVIRNVLFCFI